MLVGCKGRQHVLQSVARCEAAEVVLVPVFDVEDVTIVTAEREDAVVHLPGHVLHPPLGLHFKAEFHGVPLPQLRRDAVTTQADEGEGRDCRMEALREA